MTRRAKGAWGTKNPPPSSSLLFHPPQRFHASTLQTANSFQFCKGKKKDGGISLNSIILLEGVQTSVTALTMGCKNPLTYVSFLALLYNESTTLLIFWMVSRAASYVLSTGGSSKIIRTPSPWSRIPNERSFN